MRCVMRNSSPAMRTDTAYGHARPPHPCRFAVLVHAGVGRCAGRWPSLCTMHAPLPCNCRCLISGSSRRLPSPGMRRPALNTCTRKHGRRGRIPFLHGACVRIWSLHANGFITACGFATGWCCRCGPYRAYRTGRGNAFCCTYVARRAHGVFATGCKMRLKSC